MATPEEVERTLADLVRRLGALGPDQRALLPRRRLIQAECPDLDLVYHAELRDSRIGAVTAGAPPRTPDVVIACSSHDLLRLADGSLTLGDAYARGLVTIRASFADLLRLRAVL